MFVIHYIDQFGVTGEDSQMAFVNRGDAERVFEAIKAKFLTGAYGPEIAEVALYDERDEEMLDSSSPEFVKFVQV
jgi:hypothetical protein